MQQILENDSSERENRETVVNLWLQYSPYASWTTLAGRLFFYEEKQTLEAVSKYFDRESSGNTNLLLLL